MLTLEISPLYKNGFDCFNGLLATTASYLGRGYEMMFLKSWDFLYENAADHSGLIGTGLKRIKLREREFLEKYHGIRLVKESASSGSEALYIIRGELSSGKPVIVCVDPYWCPWLNSYKNDHALHYTMVIGINNDNSLRCIESVPLKEDACFPLKDFLEGFRYALTFKLEENALPFLDPADELKKSVRALGARDNFFDDMRRFGNRIYEGLDLAREAEGCRNFWNAPLLENMVPVGRGRILFSYLLEYLRSARGMRLMPEIPDRLRNSGDRWSSVRGLLIKGYRAPQFEQLKRRVADKVMELADYEEETASLLSKAIEGSGRISVSGLVNAGVRKEIHCEVHSEVHSEVHGQVQNEINAAYGVVQDSGYGGLVFVDISHQLNNKCFSDAVTGADRNTDSGSISDTGFISDAGFISNAGSISDVSSATDAGDISGAGFTADFTGTGQFALSKGIPEEADWEICGMRFRLPGIRGAQFDNISSSGQTLEVLQGVYSHILILGCAEWGNFSDMLTLRFEDGDEEDIKIELTDWANTPAFGETTAWQGLGAERTTAGIRVMNLTLKLFAKAFPVRTAKTATGIKLPDCPNLHFFAITLAASGAM